MARSASHLRVTHPALVTPRPGCTLELLDADIARVDTLPEARFVIHAAASADASRYLAAPVAERDNILGAASNYARLAARFHRTSRVVFCSSGAVYGQQPSTLDALPESFAALPIDAMPEAKRPYAAAKRDTEAIFQTLGAAGLAVSIARCFAFVGPHLPRDRHFAIGNFLEDALQGRPVRVLATHPVWRSYQHADDLVRWLMTICAAASPACPTFNVGSGDAYLVGDVARRVAQAAGVEAEVPALIDAPVDRYVPSVARAREQLGLRCELSLDEAIAATLLSLRVA